MKYKKYELGPYNLHVIKTDKFKKIQTKIFFKRKLVKEELPYRDLLSEMLIVTTKKYPTIRTINIKREDLYSLSNRNFSYGSGNYHIIGVTTSFLNEKFTETGMNEQSFDFLFDLILDPDVENDSFNSEVFISAKKRLMDNIVSIKESSNQYSRIRLLQEIDKKSPFSFFPNEYLEQLEKITEKDLYDYYKSVLKKDIVDIFVVGDIDYQWLKKIFSEKFKINTIKKPSGSHLIDHLKIRKRTKKVVEKSKFNQSTLMLGIKFDKLTDFESKYVAIIYSYILGGGADSKLFKTVREKHSYCYSISAGYNMINKLIVISAGIEKDNYNHVIRLIKKEMKNMRDGNFSEEDIKNVVSNYLSSHEELFDSPGGIIGYYAGIEYLKTESLEKRIENIKKVTKKDIIEFAKKVNVDTIFMLEGEAYEKNSA